jgi:hypothetical protein
MQIGVLTSEDTAFHVEEEHLCGNVVDRVYRFPDQSLVAWMCHASRGPSRLRFDHSYRKGQG